MKEGLTTVITGDGKGKTTSAIGMAIDAVARGLKVYIAFFLKGELYEHGEFKSLSRIPGITFKTYGRKGWVTNKNDNGEYREKALQGLNDARKAMLHGGYDMIVLDEVNGLISMDIISRDSMVDFIKSKPPATELILTGRKADPRVIELADSVSEYVMIKHPFNMGQKARKGIDY